MSEHTKTRTAGPRQSATLDSRVEDAGQPAGPVLSFDPETHTYRLHDAATPSAWGRVVPSVTGVLRTVGLIDDEYFTEDSRTRGRYVHKAVLYLERDGGLDDSSIDPRLAGYIAAYRRFISEARPGPCELIEKPLCDPVRRFAGTPDMTRSLNGDHALIDIKTGGKAAWWGLQLAAYESLVRLALDCGPLRRFVLQLTAEGRFTLTEFRDRGDIKIFYSALAVAQWREANR